MTALTEQGTSKQIRTKSWDIHYNEAGEGYPLVLVHGGGPGASGWSNYSPVIPYLAERYRVLTPDLPGWGKSQAVSYEERNNSAALAEFLEALGIEKAAFVGNSMGGASCIRLSYERPDLVSHLITMGAFAGAPSIYEAAGPSEGLKALVRAFVEPSDATLRKLTQLMTYDSGNVTDELIAERVRNALATPKHLENWVAGNGKGPVVALDQSRFPEISVPALFMHGRDDRVVNFAASLRLGQLVPNSRVHIVNRCGHWLQLEHTNEFNYIVDSFIQNA
ncbi:MAG TPA: alpha/beta hydrolase [Maritimibacter sp.]|nr:alpha/beta hydrolase [Maritimibacter sp.]